MTKSAITGLVNAQIEEALEGTGRLQTQFALPSVVGLKADAVNADKMLHQAGEALTTDPVLAGVALGSASVSLIRIVASSKTTATDRMMVGRILRRVATAEGLVDALTA